MRPAAALGRRKVTGLVAERRAGVLEVGRHRIVNPGVDLPRLQALLERVALAAFRSRTRW